MKNKALVVIDLQNDITKNYKKIIGKVNTAIDWTWQMISMLSISGISICPRRQEHLSLGPKALTWFLSSGLRPRSLLISPKPVP